MVSTFVLESELLSDCPAEDVLSTPALAYEPLAATLPKALPEEASALALNDELVLVAMLNPALSAVLWKVVISLSLAVL